MVHDKDLSERVAKLEVKFEIIEEEHSQWQRMYDKIVLKIVGWLISLVIAGSLFGYLSEDAKKILVSWLTK